MWCGEEFYLEDGGLVGVFVRLFVCYAMHGSCRVRVEMLDGAWMVVSSEMRWGSLGRKSDPRFVLR